MEEVLKKYRNIYGRIEDSNCWLYQMQEAASIVGMDKYNIGV